jgi:hypothetical protein
VYDFMEEMQDYLSGCDDVMLKQIGQWARVSLAHKHLGTTGAVGVALRVISRELVCDEPLREGYIRHGVLYVRLEDHALVMRLFQQKARLMDLVNAEWEKVGFSHRVVGLRSVK